MAQDRKHIVIIGGNFAGISALQAITKQLPPKVDVTLIDSNDNFSWTPNIHEILSGVKTPGNVQICRKTLVHSLGGRFIQDRGTHIDHQKQTVTLSSGATLAFDALIKATGMPTSANNHPSTYTFRSASDALKISAKIDLLTRIKEQINIIIIGGGFTGVEVLGELLRQYQQSNKVKLALVEAGDRLVKTLPEVVSQDIVRLCDKSSASLYFNRRLSKQDNDAVYLSDDTKLPSDITIYTSGALLASMNSEQSPTIANYNQVNESLQSTESKLVLCAGDSASFSMNGLPLPKQSYYAQEMGKIAGVNALRLLSGKPLTSFSPKVKPVLLSFGDMNTYLVSGELVLASPALVSMKEALYQLGSQKVMSSMPLLQRGTVLLNQFKQSAQSALQSDGNPYLPGKVLHNSKVLQAGKHSDVQSLAQSAFATLLE
ncbi:NAD(P)/FAD-dependent oxidoreductase [Planctobacterium marinum]|uniref:NADH dehydrogenase-like protein YjlD n=1 Tax=Planctobacterium marinum TaxID=1631968 RepID=A0AA48KRV5_9ALTE|nr:NADH dehydrogenase-like protein YjlD [Planctobacterium marinum]